MRSMHWENTRCPHAFRMKRGKWHRKNHASVTCSPKVKVTCHYCLKSKQYKEDMTSFEIGYDGNVIAYLEATRPNGPSPQDEWWTHGDPIL